MVAGARDSGLALVTRYGRNVGLAFKIVDDVLDVTGTTESLGKDAGSDIENQKATYPRLFGVEKSRKMARALADRARLALKPLGKKGEALAAIADFIVDRVN